MLDLGFNTEDGAIAVDYNGRIAFWNVAAQHLLGLRAEEVMGRRCENVLMGRDESGALICRKDCEVVAASREGRGCPTRDLLVPTSRGAPLWISLSSFSPSRLHAPAGTVVHVFHNINERKRLEFLARKVARDLAELGLDLPANVLEASREQREPLTNRERQVLELLARGVDARKIASNLCISEGTVRKHIQNILTKLGAHGQVQAVSYAVSHRLVTLESGDESTWASGRVSRHR